MTMRNLLARGFRKATFLLEPPQKPVDHIQIEDDFVKWLCFANAGMLDRGNLYLMDYAISRIHSASPLLEIGSFCGLSANILTHYKRKRGIKNSLITCDKWDFENGDADRERVGGSPVLFSDYRSFVRDSFLRNIGLFSASDLPFTIEATSEELFDLWRAAAEARDVFGRSITLGGPISFCYIDGNHTYDGAKRDFVNCDSFLEDGGFLLFDDSTVPAFGVKDLMPQIVASGRYKLVAQNPNHLFQKTSA